MSHSQPRSRLTTICSVFIRDLTIQAQIGIHNHEHGRLQPIRINIHLVTEAFSAEKDDMAHVVDYSKIETTVRTLVTSKHTRTAETLATQIADICLTDDRVKSAKVRLEKLHALPGAESAGVEIEKSRIP